MRITNNQTRSAKLRDKQKVFIENRPAISLEEKYYFSEVLNLSSQEFIDHIQKVK